MKAKKFRVHEIFYSFEGEGTRVGTPQVFIRLQGCKVGCRWCDTPLAQPLKGGREMSLIEILREVSQYRVSNVSLTGGDPLLQDIVPLCNLLKANGYYLSLEATGLQVYHPAYDVVDFISADIKTPSSGVRLDPSVPKKLYERYSHKIQLKAVVADNEDLDWLLKHFKYLPLVLTPEQSKLSLVKNLLKTNLPSWWRVIPQVHKLLGVE